VKILTSFIACSVFLTACAQFTSEPPEVRPHPEFVWTTAKARRIPDKDIRSFISRANLTGGTEIEAVADLVRDLKKGGLWRKLYGFYPFVGSNASACGQNLVSSAYTITWSGPLTFTSGVTGDGVNYGDTGFPLSQVSATNVHLYGWIAADAASDTGPIFGTGNTSPANLSYLYLNGGNFDAWGPNANFAVSTTFSGGNLLMERTNATKVFVLTDSFAADEDEVLATATANTIKVLGALPINVAKNAGTLRAFSVGQSLTYSEATNYFAIVNRFQTALGRGTP
jgi:hypothetical protein